MPSEVKTKAVVLSIEGKPVLICKVQEFSATEFVKMRTLCEENHKRLKDSKSKKEEELLSKIKELEKQVRILKGEE